MQKIALSRLIREELTRALIFGVAFFIILSLGLVSVAHAANGGKFGEILNRILASGNWETDTTGTVANAAKLGGKLPAEFVPVKAGQSCASNKCITGFTTDGTVQCSP
jgi:hypothetical protein